jgi:hypothetical protein
MVCRIWDGWIAETACAMAGSGGAAVTGAALRR